MADEAEAKTVFAVRWSWATPDGWPPEMSGAKKGQLTLKPKEATVSLKGAWKIRGLLTATGLVFGAAAGFGAIVGAVFGTTAGWFLAAFIGIAWCLLVANACRQPRTWQLRPGSTEVVCDSPTEPVRFKAYYVTWIALRADDLRHRAMVEGLQRLFRAGATEARPEAETAPAEPAEAVPPSESDARVQELLAALRKDPKRCPACGGRDIRRLERSRVSVAGDMQCRRCQCTWDPGWGRPAAAVAAFFGALFAAAAPLGILMVIRDLLSGNGDFVRRGPDFSILPALEPYLNVGIWIVMFVLCGWIGALLLRKGLGRLLRKGCGVRILQPPQRPPDDA